MGPINPDQRDDAASNGWAIIGNIARALTMVVGNDTLGLFADSTFIQCLDYAGELLNASQ